MSKYIDEAYKKLNVDYYVSDAVKDALRYARTALMSQIESYIHETSGFNNSQYNEIVRQAAIQTGMYLNNLEDYMNHLLVSYRYDWDGNPETYIVDKLIKNHIVDLIYRNKQGEYKSAQDYYVAGKLANVLENLFMMFYYFGIDTKLNPNVDMNKPIYEDGKIIGYKVKKDRENKNIEKKIKDIDKKINNKYAQTSNSMIELFKIAEKMSKNEELTDEDKKDLDEALDNVTPGLIDFVDSFNNKNKKEYE